MKEGNNGNANNGEKRKVEGAHRIVNVHKSQIGKSKSTDDERANAKKKSAKTESQGRGKTDLQPGKFPTTHRNDGSIGK